MKTETHMKLIQAAFVAGRSHTTWDQFKKDNGLASDPFPESDDILQSLLGSLEKLVAHHDPDGDTFLIEHIEEAKEVISKAKEIINQSPK